MIERQLLANQAAAAATLGIVLAEAILLYRGYGLLIAVVSPRIGRAVGVN